MSETQPIVVTGAAGFVGHAVAERLLARGERVIGLDDFNGYYDPALKEARAARLCARDGFALVRGDVADSAGFAEVLRASGARRVVHLAAQAGVRYDNPAAYAHSNLSGHLAVLEACRAAGVIEHLVYASSSSVYGARGAERPFAEDDPLGRPTSLYAATKIADEAMSGAYAHLYALPQTGLRFFTVYGPWGRPDMAYYAFTRAILAGETIELFDEGRLARDFTYIDDIADGVVAVLDRPPADAEHRVFNIGGGRPETVAALIANLEGLLGVRARVTSRPKPAADLPVTFADVRRLKALTGYAPQVRLADGLARFVNWYRGYHG